MQRFLLVSVTTLLLGVACRSGKPAVTPATTLSRIGEPIPAAFCQSTQPLSSLPPPRAVLARTEAELAAEVRCVGGQTLAARLHVDFRDHYVLVVSLTGRAGGEPRIDRIEDDGTTLTVFGGQTSGGCSGTAQPNERATFTVLVAAKERAVRVQMSPPDPGPMCDPRPSSR